MPETQPERPSAETLGKLWGMIRSVQFAMLTSDDGGLLRARPMVASQRDFDGTLYFFTRAGSHKTEEIRHDDRVCVSYADPQKQNYVSLSGRARLERDQGLIREHWSEALRTWFPKGVDDPDVAVLCVSVEAAEYWDAPSSTAVHLFGYAKAVMTGTPPHPGENRKLNFS